MHYWVSCVINKGSFFEIAFSSSTHICFALRHLLTFCLMVRHCLWKMFATLSACIKPGLVQRPLCHKVNLPRCESRRRHLIRTCDIFDTGQTNTLTLCYLFGKTYKPAHSSATLQSMKSTRPTKLLEKLLMGAAHTFH